MSRLQLIIAVREPEYIARLADYIQTSPFGEQWQLTAFTQTSALRQFIRTGYPVQVIAAQPDLLAELGDGLPEHIAVAALVTRAGQTDGLREVLQYQPLPQLLHDLTAVYAASGGSAIGGRDQATGHRAHVVAVYGAVGGIGKTTLSISLARQAGGREARVFYLNLERWNATSAWFGGEGGDDFSQLLYTIQAYPGKAEQAIAQYRKRHATLKFDYFAPCRNSEERLSMSGEDAKRLVSAIADTGLYDLLIIDLDSGLDAVHQAIFTEADNVLCLLSCEQITMEKTKLALTSGERKYGDTFQEQLRKFRYIASHAAGSSGTVRSEDGFRVEGVIPFVAAWSAEGAPQSESGHGAGAYHGAVEAILERICLLERAGEHAGRSRTAAQG